MPTKALAELPDDAGAGATGTDGTDGAGEAGLVGVAAVGEADVGPLPAPLSQAVTIITAKLSTAHSQGLPGELKKGVCVMFDFSITAVGDVHAARLQDRLCNAFGAFLSAQQLTGVWYPKHDAGSRQNTK